MKKQTKELIICAMLQGFGKDLRPLYKHPVLDGVLYFKLLKIGETQNEHG